MRTLCKIHSLANVALAAFVLLAAFGSSPARAADGGGLSEQAIKSLLESRLNLSKVDSVTRLPILNLYEVRVGKEIVYVDNKGEYLFLGNVIDLKTGQNLTKARLDESSTLPRTRISDLPLASAFKVVKGNGKRQVAIFTDPNCPYCKRLEETLASVTDVTIHVFLYPILGPDSTEKARQIWCAPDRAKAWHEWMLNGNAPPPVSGACTTPIEKNVALGRSLKVDGTPTMFFASGRRTAGAVGSDDLRKLLAQG